MATMREVAQEAGVSVTTVSHVINGTRYVSDELEVQVRQAIERLNYQPDHRARSLRRGRSETIAVVISDIGNTFFADIVRGIEDRLLENGYGVLLCNTGEDPNAERRNVSMMLEQRVDGLIVAPSSQGEHVLSRLVEEGTPLVVVDRPVDLDVDQVYSNNEQGAYDATEHLISLGHRRIGTIVEIEGIRTFDDRLRGWRRAMADHDVPIDPCFVQQAGLEIEGAAAAARRLTEAPCGLTAVFSSNNLMTLGVLKHLRDHGLEYPRDLSIVGFDDPAWAGAISPALTSVAQAPFEMGYRAAEMLIRRIDGWGGPAEQVCLDCGLRVRESTAPFVPAEAP